MATTDFYYYDQDNQKQGPVSKRQIKELAAQKIITPETLLEDDGGNQEVAGQVPGLFSSFGSTPAQAAPVPAADSQFGKILVSGNGNGNPALAFGWASSIISAVLGCAIFLYFAHDLESQVAGARGSWFVNQAKLNEAKQMASVFRGIAIFGAVLTLVFGVIYHRSIASTRIHVFETGIVGKGAGKGFLLGDPRLFGFRLPYNQVTSVDVGGSTIIVHATGAQYKCYVANPAEIQRVIVEQQQKRT